jgi:hypothetical protein
MAKLCKKKNTYMQIFTLPNGLGAQGKIKFNLKGALCISYKGGGENPITVE